MLDAFESDAEAQRLLGTAEALSGLDLRAIAAEGPESALADTRAAQPLLYVADLAWARSLASEGLVTGAVAGHSLGELAALAFAGVFSAEAGLELVVSRGRLMAEAAAEAPGTMSAVLGMDGDAVRELLVDTPGVWVANDNSPGQIVISGTHDGVERATMALTSAGARKIIPLSVAGPFHSPLMQAACAAFGELLDEAEFADAAIPVLQNTDPAPARSGALIRQRLAGQMVSPVRWTETMYSLRDVGVNTLVEAGPGAVLTGLARRVEGLTSVSAESDGIARVMEVACS